jgi:tetratricopeptide (TPR) repeat protein
MAGSKIDTPGAVSNEDRERLKALGYVSMQATVDDRPGLASLPDPKDKIAVLEQYRAGLDLVRAGDMPAAIRAFKGLTSDNPGLADAWGELAGLLVRMGRLDEALAAYKKLVEAAPHDPAAIVSVAQTLIDLGRLDEARLQAEAALKMLPDTEHRWRASSHKMLMRIAMARRDLATARSEAKLAEAADPEMPLTDYLEGLIAHKAGRFEEALPHFTAALRKVQGRTFQVPDVRYYLADTLARLARYEEAERLFREELHFFPASFRSHAGLAMLYQAQGRPVDAAGEIEDMVRVSPSPASFALAAQLWDMFGERGKAAETRRRAQQVTR